MESPGPAQKVQAPERERCPVPKANLTGAVARALVFPRDVGTTPHLLPGLLEAGLCAIQRGLLQRRRARTRISAIAVAGFGMHLISPSDRPLSDPEVSSLEPRPGRRVARRAASCLVLTKARPHQSQQSLPSLHLRPESSSHPPVPNRRSTSFAWSCAPCAPDLSRRYSDQFRALMSLDWRRLPPSGPLQAPLRWPQRRRQRP